MKSFLLTLSAMVVLIAKSALATQDPSIDRLLSKLPPPEKFVDPAINDPLAKQMIAAAKAQNFGSALDAARKLAGRYPKSLGAQMVHGMLAIALRRFPEASAAYHKALALHPDLAAAYVGLGASEFFQQHFGAALTDFRHVTQLAPKAEVGWTGASVCAERLGRRQESLEYARRATVVAPSSAAAWYQLAREEGLFGNKQAAATALARANKLQRNAPQFRSSGPKTPRS
ncbi:MAG: Tetratricopeptide repeat [Verrucomicrobiota bacterium]|jgi:tetratricopeptide (TPR) repeat protein